MNNSAHEICEIVAIYHAIIRRSSCAYYFNRFVERESRMGASHSCSTVGQISIILVYFREWVQLIILHYLLPVQFALQLRACDKWEPNSKSVVRLNNIWFRLVPCSKSMAIGRLARWFQKPTSYRWKRFDWLVEKAWNSTWCTSEQFTENCSRVHGWTESKIGKEKNSWMNALHELDQIFIAGPNFKLAFVADTRSK